MDIFNRAPAISEDTLQYTIYPPSGLSDKASATTFAACIQDFVDSLLPGFLWHRDAFELKVVPDPDNGEWMLERRMRVGDCVDDEWCTVWLLKEISSKWDVVISVFDSDGEFLLIEAAEALPAWVKPTNSENRVWICKSRLHLIPISHVSPPSRKRRRRALLNSRESDDEGDGTLGMDDEEEFIAVEDALNLVRNPQIDTFAPPTVEKLVWQRIAGYPAATKSHVHVTKAYIPADIARALAVNPSLVQKPVETFYTRDAIQLRAAHRMARFPPEPSVLTTIKMTRTAYAQLVGQKFFPPKIFGRWKEKEGTDEWRWRDVGMKIACGFEMLYQESKGRTDVSSKTAEALSSSTAAVKEALRRNPEYITYIQNLVSAGYFKEEVEGSQLWNTLEDKAATIFVDVRREDDATRQSFASLVSAAISQAQNVSIAPTQEAEDSDDWLNLDAADFENMLEETMGSSKHKTAPTTETDLMDVDKEESPEDRLATEQAKKLQNLAAKVEQFVDGEGDMEGARFEDEEFSDEEFSDDTMSSESEDDDDNVDSEDKVAARRAAMDKLVPGIEPSEYGQMPASFHNNSQRVAPTTIETDTISELPDEIKAELASEPRVKPIRQPILPRDKYDGVDSDDETDEEDVEEEDEEEDDRPQVVGEIEVDMEQEEEEFLEFSRQALGITDEQWSEIVRDRKDRGAFVPAGAFAAEHWPSAEKSTNVPKGSANATETKGREPAPGPRPNVNPNLDSFEAVMKAMDEELSRSRPNKNKAKKDSSTVPDKGKGKAKASVADEEEDDDIEAAMDAELRGALDKGEDDGEEDDGQEETMDYNMIKNFLESYKSQGGLSGPVGNLAGRLQPGWKLPRDES